MSSLTTIQINFKGGIISPGELYNILVAAGRGGVLFVRFGLRQQLLFDVDSDVAHLVMDELNKLDVSFETEEDKFPNIVSSYPAAGIFINNSWLTEGVYKDIFDMVDYQPSLKINFSDSNQSLTPMLTGNINWIASPVSPHFWHLFIRFPKTNSIYEWKDMVYTNHLAQVSQQIEKVILKHPDLFVDNELASGDDLYKAITSDEFITKPVTEKLKLADFNLPYYEGLNRYHDKTWLGIYRRDELFSSEFLKEVCSLCLQTKVGHFCSTPWKSIIVKGIEEKDREKWNQLLAKHQINVRHAANELNFQVEDNCKEGLQLKQYLVKHLNNNDVRTFGVCFGIKMRNKSEVFSSVLIKRKSLIKIGRYRLFNFYDILCAKNYNPNERTGFVFSSFNTKALLPEQLRRVVTEYNSFQSESGHHGSDLLKQKPAEESKKEIYVFQCKHCMSVCEEEMIEADTAVVLAADYSCSLCEAPASDFVKINKAELGLQPV